MHCKYTLGDFRHLNIPIFNPNQINLFVSKWVEFGTSSDIVSLIWSLLQNYYFCNHINVEAALCFSLFSLVMTHSHVVSSDAYHFNVLLKIIFRVHLDQQHHSAVNLLVRFLSLCNYAVLFSQKNALNEHQMRMNQHRSLISLITNNYFTRLMKIATFEQTHSFKRVANYHSNVQVPFNN